METICNICPRKCNANRVTSSGFCKLNDKVKIALVSLHFGEEPIISGSKGSGTIFFSGCNLKCVYCQNYELSHSNFGKEISVQRLAEIFKELEDKGAHNINLVSPTPYATQIIKALDIYKPNIPIVYNTNGYDSVDTLKLLKNYIDIYLTDFKYADNSLALKYSKCANYCEQTLKSILQMRKNQPNDVIENQLMKKGLIIRHLVLPNHSDDSCKVLDLIKEHFSSDTIISIMGQYTPCGNVPNELNRTLKSLEYKRVIAHFNSLNFTNGFMQELSSASSSQIPDFNLNGV